MPEPRGKIEGKNGRNSVHELSVFRNILFYAISLLLSLMIIVMAATIMAVMYSLNGSVTTDLLALFFIIISVNVMVAAFSLRGIMKLYPVLAHSMGNQRVIRTSAVGKGSEDNGIGLKFTEENFTGLELEIVGLIRQNRNSMLQNRIVASTGSSKATVSRALDSLERKGAVIKVRKGVTNEIILVEKGDE